MCRETKRLPFCATCEKKSGWQCTSAHQVHAMTTSARPCAASAIDSGPGFSRSTPPGLNGSTKSTWTSAFR
jgi:hypothetical protein